MKTEVNNDLIRVIILDISGLYAQIYNQGYFTKDSIEEIHYRYNDVKHWRVIII